MVALAAVFASACAESRLPPPAWTDDQLASSSSAVCAVRSGRVLCFGVASASLGRSDVVFDPWPASSTEPFLAAAPVEGIDAAIAVTSGPYGYCALHGGGRVSCWGERVPTTSGCEHALAAVPVGIVGLPPAVAVDGGFGGACAIGEDGLVRCWGCGSRSSLGLSGAPSERVDLAGPSVIPGIGDAVAFVSTSCVRTRGEEVLCWGDNPSLDRLLPPDGREVGRALAPLHGARSVVLLDAQFRGIVVAYDDGRVLRHGVETVDGVSTPIDWEPVLDIDGSLELDGWNPCALGLDGRVRCHDGWGFTGGEAAVGAVPGLVRVLDITVRSTRGCALVDGGELWCWGAVPHPDVDPRPLRWTWPPAHVDLPS
jgi:hypothetical protein